MSDAIVAAKLIRRVSLYDCDCIGAVEIVREKVERTAIPGELSGTVFISEIVDDSDEDDTAAVRTQIDIGAPRFAETVGLNPPVPFTPVLKMPICTLV